MAEDDNRPDRSDIRRSEHDFRKAVIAQQRMTSPAFGRHLGGVMLGDSLSDYEQRQDVSITSQFTAFAQNLVDAVSPINVGAGFKIPEEQALPPVPPQLSRIGDTVSQLPAEAPPAVVPEKPAGSQQLPEHEQGLQPERRSSSNIPFLRASPIPEDLFANLGNPDPSPEERATGSFVVAREASPTWEPAGHPTPVKWSFSDRMESELKMDLDDSIEDYDNAINDVLRLMRDRFESMATSLRRLYDSASSEGEDVQ